MLPIFFARRGTLGLARHLALSGRFGQRGLALIVALIALAAMSLAAIWLVKVVNTNIAIASNLAFRQSAVLSADDAAEEARAWLLDQSHNHAEALNQNDAASFYSASKGDGTGKSCGETGFDGVDFMGNCTLDDASDNLYWRDADTPNTPQDGGTVTARGEKIPTPRCGKAGDNHTDKTGNLACYVIQRMCTGQGDPKKDAISCDTAPAAGQGHAGDPGDHGGGTCGVMEGNPCGGGKNDTATGQGQSKYYRITVRVSGPRQNTIYTQTFLIL